MNRQITSLAFVLTVALMPSCGTGRPVPITHDELVRNTQEIVDSIVPADHAPWIKYFADDAMYFDETGKNMDKTGLIDNVTPLPAGYSGAIKVVNARSNIQANTAILSYDMDETETVFGQNLTARYHATDTWMERNGRWQIVAGQVLRYYEDPAPGKTDTRKYAEYAGTYELAPGVTQIISVRDGKLYSKRGERPEAELIPESCDIFFVRGVEGRRLFPAGDNPEKTGATAMKRSESQKDGQKIRVMIDRRNNEDLLWKKIK